MSRLSRISLPFIVAFLLPLICVVGTSSAQTVQVSADTKSTHFVGVPLSFEIVISDVSMFADAKCEFLGTQSSELTVRQGRVSKQSFNGVGSIRYGFECVSGKKGTVEVGPFKVSVGDQEVELKPIVFEFGEVPVDPNMTVDLRLPSSRIYVGQRVPVEIEWAIYGESNDEVNHAFNKQELRSNLFDMFEFSDVARSSQRQLTLRIATRQGAAELAAEQKVEEREGKNFLVVTAKRYFTPDKSGVFDNILLSCNSERATRFRRSGSFFSSGYQPVDPRPISATSPPVRLEVLPIPTEGRPVGFGGAVGESFTVKAATNRSVVRVGDPISLDVTLSGAGNLSDISIPLDGPTAILDRNVFDLPSEPPTGNVSSGRKQFKIPIRVTDPSVTEIPPIAVSWFNPVSEEFGTAYSKPIALQVKEAQMLDNAAIVSAQPTNQEPSESDSPTPPRSRMPIEFTAANLAIETDPAILLSSAGVFHFGALHWLFYGFSLALVLAAILLRRAQSGDPKIAQSKSLSRQVMQQVDAAASAEPVQGLAEIAEALRRWMAENPTRPRESLDRLVAKCEELRFAGSSIEVSQLQAIAAEAKGLLEEAEGRR